MGQQKSISLLVVLSSPSGGGKTTICKALVSRHPDFKKSLTASTRKPRTGEVNGVDYLFFSEPEFFKRVRNQEFLEYENIHGYYYGTPKAEVEKLLNEGFSVLFDIDVNGALSIKKIFPRAILIFIRPPSLEELKKRLLNRKTDDTEEISKRLKRLPEEFAKADQFDYDIINDSLEETIEKIYQIISKHQQQEIHATHQSTQK
ncbi:MAG: guanylate kinase [Caldithrix sp. RBG_13_44_9]|nr:MAG: guanylate kinase [Caldithrix sp. RBG_13_44_9]